MAEIRYKLEHPHAKTPQKASEGAAGWDVIAAEMRINHESNYVEYDIGISFELPSYTFLDARPRSSISKFEWVLCNGAGVVDEDYRGTVRFRFRPTNPEIDVRDEQPYKIGDRVGQIILQKYLKQDYVLADNLSDTSRGTGGHGSTGT